MTYFGFLAIFLLIPLVIVTGLNVLDRRRGKPLPAALAVWPAYGVVLAHVLVALIYTTPWDNYLVATRVWWYNPELVTGLLIGYVPIEEYTFFVLQTLLSGGLWIFLARRFYAPDELPVGLAPRPALWLRAGLTLTLGAGWIWSVVVLANGWQPGNYLALIAVWALPPVMIQVGFGGDILWRFRKLTMTAVLVPTIYLGLADSLAISAGTWIINPEKTLGVYLGGVLPLEELIFFLATNVLIGFGMTLVCARLSHARVHAAGLGRLRAFLPGARLETPHNPPA